METHSLHRKAEANRASKDGSNRSVIHDDDDDDDDPLFLTYLCC